MLFRSMESCSPLSFPYHMMHLTLLLVYPKASCPIPSDEQSSVLILLWGALVIGALECSYACVALVDAFVDEGESSLAKKVMLSSSIVEHC